MHGFLLHESIMHEKTLQEPIKAQIQAQKPLKTAFLPKNQTKKRKMYKNNANLGQSMAQISVHRQKQRIKPFKGL